MVASSSMTFLTKLRSFLESLNSMVHHIGRFPQQQGVFGMPAVSYDYGLVPEGCTAGHHRNPSDSLSEMFGAILNYKVPRNRRSLERRHIRKHSEHYIQAAKPKTNIIICLRCGKPHEAETICGNCYSKVRTETEHMRKSMGEDTYYYDHPRKEVAYLYEGESIEQFPKYKGRYVVQLDKPRPSWFPATFLDKKNDPDKTS